MHACCLQVPNGEHTATTNRAATFTSALVPSIDDVCSSILQVRVQCQQDFIMCQHDQLDMMQCMSMMALPIVYELAS